MNRASTRRHWKPAILAIGVLAAIVAIVVGLSGGNGRANAQDNDPHQNGVGCDDKLFATSSPPFGGHDVPVGPCNQGEVSGSQTATASPSVTQTTTATATATESATATATESATVTNTATATPTESATPTMTATEAASPSPSPSASPSPSPSPSPSASPSTSPSPSPTATTPTIFTTPSAGGAVGVVLNDMATLSGGSNPLGSITFALFAPGDNTCAGPAVFTETVNVNGNNTYSTTTGFTSTTAGTYNWMATFTSSDSNNLNAETACGDEAVVVSTPVVITTPSPTVTETAVSSATPTESATASVTPTESATTTSTATATGTTTATSTTSNVTIETPTTGSNISGSNISSSNISSGVSQNGISSNVSGATLSGATPSAPSTGSAQPDSTSTSPFLWAGFGLLALTAGTAVLFLATRKR